MFNGDGDAGRSGKELAGVRGVSAKATPGRGGRSEGRSQRCLGEAFPERWCLGDGGGTAWDRTCPPFGGPCGQYPKGSQDPREKSGREGGRRPSPGPGGDSGVSLSPTGAPVETELRRTGPAGVFTGRLRLPC